MKPVVAWFAKNPVAANLLMWVLIVGGLFAAINIKVELFPEFSMDMVQIRVMYPGAAPQEVEEGICIPIEEEINAIEGIEEITSSASEGMGSVMIEVRAGEDPRRVLDDVKTRVDAVDTFPEEAEKPVIEELLMRRQVINVAVYGEADEATLKRIGERVRDEINEIDGISQVQLANARPYEISIEVSEEALRRHGLSFDEVAAAVRRSSLDLSGGSLKTSGGEILLRTVGQAYHGPEFDEIVVMTRPDGTRVHLREVATVVDGFEDTDQEARFNGLPVVMVQVFRVGDESALQVASAVQEYVEQLRPELPEGIRAEVWQDASEILRSRLNLLLRNGAQGLALVFAVLALFLRFRISIWVSIGIPLSFLGALMVMAWTGTSVNMLSLFAFILVLGIVVDDAIVVAENVDRERQRGLSGLKAAVRGVQGISVPVVFAVLTSVLAFMPMLNLPGIMGKFLAVIPLTVIPALLFSLVESQLVLPAHLSHEGRLIGTLACVPPFRWWTRLQEAVSRALFGFVDHVYRPTLSLALRWRYAAISMGVATLLGAGGLVAGGFVKFFFFPDIEGDVIAAQLAMPEGTSAQVTARAVARLEESALQIRRELEDEGEEGPRRVVRNLMASIGEQPYLTQQRGFAAAGGPIVGSHFGEVVIELVPSEERVISSAEVANRWRDLCGPIPGTTELTFASALMHAGDPIHVQFTGHDIDELRAVAEELKGHLVNYQGVFDAKHTYRSGKDELVLDVEPAAEALGLSRMALARQVRQGFYGEEAQRVQRGRDEVKVMVRYPEEDRRSLYGLESMRVRTPSGGEVPFSAVASSDRRQGYSTIARADRRRMVNVTANVDHAVANPNEIIEALREDVLPGLLEAHPGVSYSLEGQSSDQMETMMTGGRLFLLALLAMYGLMAIPFRSYLQPAIIMLAIPFGVVGAIVGHLVMGIDLSILSLMGIIALSGVVVNDSLVMVDFVNRNRDAGLSVVEAARAAGVARFRPILLTTLTTFAGLTPLLLEQSLQARFLVPMAVSLAFGVVFATVISLILVPCAYLVLDDLKRAWVWLYGSAAAQPAAGEATPGT